MRSAAASVSFMTCGRGRGFGLAAGVGEAGVMSVMCFVLTAIQWRIIAFEKLNANSTALSLRVFLTRTDPHPGSSPGQAFAGKRSATSPHIEDKARLVGHSVPRSRRVPDQ